MKKLLISLIPLICFLSGDVPALAVKVIKENEMHVGVGAHFHQNSFNKGTAVNPKFKKNAITEHLLLGIRLCEGLSFEGGGTFFSRSKTRNVHFDFVGHIPLAEKVDLLAMGGVGFMKQSRLVFTKPRAESSKTGLRVGIGVQYRFLENVSTRIYWHHQDTFHKNDKAVVKGMTVTGAALIFHF